jgi:hypothetical protein
MKQYLGCVERGFGTTTTCFGYCCSPSSGCFWVSLDSYTCNVTWVGWGALSELLRDCGCIRKFGSHTLWLDPMLMSRLICYTKFMCM